MMSFEGLQSKMNSNKGQAVREDHSKTQTATSTTNNGGFNKQTANIGNANQQTNGKQNQQKNGKNIQSVRIIGFKRLLPTTQPEATRLLLGKTSYLLNVVLVECGCSQAERLRLSEVQRWLGEQGGVGGVRLWKITKQQAFLQTYNQLVVDSLNTIFVSCLAVQAIKNQPLQQLYHQMDSNRSYSLQKINQLSKHNRKKIQIVLLKEHLEQLHPRNYFHASVHLITTASQQAIQFIQDALAPLQKETQAESSSIHTQDLQQFQQAFFEEPQLAKSPKKQKNSNQNSPDPAFRALQQLNSTPGVGQYNLK